MQLKGIEKKETNQVELTISVDKEEFDKAMNQAYRKNVGKMNVPGFRKGKAPRKIIEKMYGEGVFFEDAVNACYPAAYDAAVAEAKIEPVDHPEVTVDELSPEGFTFKALVTVKPEVKISDYKGLIVEKSRVSVTEKDVKEELNRMADRNARLETVDRPVKDGDTVTLDFEGFVDGVAFEGGKGENYTLGVGSGMFIPGFEEQIVGKKAEEPFDVNVTFPEQYQAAELAGKPAVFKCLVHEVKETQKPALDDEFAKDVSEFDTLDELKADLKVKIKENKERAAENEYDEKLIDAMLEHFEAEIPEVMFEAQIDRIVEDFGYKLSMQGMGLDTYLQMNDMPMESFRKLFREQAEKQVKVRLALEAIAAQENLEVSEEELDKEFASLAEQNNLPADRVKQLLPAESLRGDLLTQKAVELIKSAAKKPAKKAAKKAGEKEANAEENN
ncbi:MAG: trigger factor [Clostridiaceae bacterium]|jgi:trigger factor|nr:trigger factor [Clostridiaceae bacterium]